MTGTEKKKIAFLSVIKRFFTTNILLKIIAVVFAMLLWGYVLTDQKPLRTKIIPDVTLSFDGEAELRGRGLCVRGDRSEILRQVSVAVRAQITNYAYLTNGTINAVVSLRNISEAREYTLPIQATVTSSLGTVQSVTPATVTLEIDVLRTKTIPVKTILEGELPNGFWADTDAMTTTGSVNILGPRTDVAQVVRAECVVNLNGQTNTIYRTFDVVLYDAGGSVVSSNIVTDTIPSSTVRLLIYPMKVVPVDVIGSLIGLDNLAKNHELVNVIVTPATVRLVGDAALLDAITSVSIEPITVNGYDVHNTAIAGTIIPPEGVRMVDGDTVSIALDIRERMDTVTFKGIPVVVSGLAPNLIAEFSVTDVDISIEGRYSLVSMIKRGDISILADLSGLGPGVYTIRLFVHVRDEATTVELTTRPSPAEITVTIKAP